MTSGPNDWNTNIINEFRANDGKLGGHFSNAPVLLLHTTGAKSGLERVTPVMYLQDGDRWAVFASKAGAPSHPDWFRNIQANPEVAIEVGSETIDVRATVAGQPERDALYGQQAALFPQFAEYETKTDRVIPVVVLTRR